MSYNLPAGADVSDLDALEFYVLPDREVYSGPRPAPEWCECGHDRAGYWFDCHCEEKGCKCGTYRERAEKRKETA